MINRTFVTIVLVLTLASPAMGGPTIAAGPLVAPDDGKVSCGVANVSATKTVEYTVALHGSSGSAVHGPFTHTLQPLTNNHWIPSFTGGQLHCIVEITKGSKKHFRLSAMTLNANGETIAAVPGQR